MWNYEKRLQYPVKITQTNPKLAQVIISQFGGPDGELAASMRYLSQRYTMPYKEVTGILTDIGTEDLPAHQGSVSGGNRKIRIRPLLRGSHARPVAAGSQRDAVDSYSISVKRGSDHRSARRSGCRWCDFVRTTLKC